MSMDFLSSIVDKMEQTKVDLEMVCETKSIGEKVDKIEPNEIANWEYRDRHDFELGNIDELAESIELKGQAQPIILVKSSDIFKSSENIKSKYIVIAGYRRWLACKSRNIAVDSIVRNMSFEQAIACLVSENEKEKVSDYSKGMFYYKVLKKEGLTKRALHERLGIKKGMFDNYISFSEVPSEIWDAVGDLSRVSARTSSTIKLLCQKGTEYKTALIFIANKIAEGIGEKKIISLVNKELSKNTTNKAFKSATRVAFSDFIYMEHKSDHIKLGLKNISDENVDLLKSKISEMLTTFIQDM